MMRGSVKKEKFSLHMSSSELSSLEAVLRDAATDVAFAAEVNEAAGLHDVASRQRQNAKVAKRAAEAAWRLLQKPVIPKFARAQAELAKLEEEGR